MGCSNILIFGDDMRYLNSIILDMGYLDSIILDMGYFWGKNS
jgi:hypothetical protein